MAGMSTLSTDQVVLDRLKVATMGQVQRHLLEDAQFVARTADVAFFEDRFTGNLCLSLRALVLGLRREDRERTVHLDVPASWWQHLKRDHTPEWFTRRRPVRYERLTRTITFSVHQTYPNASIALPEDRFGQPVIVHQAIGDTSWRSA
jgi:hypothetical protein